MRPATNACRHCKAALPPITGKRGRPNEVCGPKCSNDARQAKRRAATAKRRQQRGEW